LTRLRSENIWHIYSRKDSPIWWAWRHNPKPSPKFIRKSTGKKKNEFTREEVSRMVNPGSTPYTTGHSIQWLEDHIQDKLKFEDLTKKTRNLYTLSFRYLKEIYGPEYSIHNISRDVIDKYKSHLLKRGVSKTTVNDYLRNLRASFERILMDGKIDHNPFYRFKPLKEEQKRKALTLSELREFLDFAKENAQPSSII